MEIQKLCKYCGRSFIAHKMTTIYCSRSCNNKDYKRAIRQKQVAEYYEAHPEDKKETPKDVLQGKAFLTPREAAKLLGIGKSSVYRELASGLIKAVQMKGKTLIRRADIERLFDNPPAYQSHSEKKQEKREYYTFRQIMEKFKCSKKAVMTRVEKYNIPKVYQGRNCFFDRALVDVHFAQLIAEIDLRDYYTIPQLEEKYKMSHASVLSFVTRYKIPRITQGRTVYYSRAHIDTIKGERESIDPNYYTYAEIMEKFHFSKDQVSYYVHNYEIDNHKQGRFTVINRKEHVQAKTRDAKTPKLIIKHLNYYNEAAIEQLFNRDPEKFEVPEDYITAQEIAKRFKVTVHHVHGRTREANIPKITVKHVNFYELKAVEALFAKNEASEELQKDESAEWLSGTDVEEMLGITTSARRSFVSRHKIPSKKEHGIAYYLRSAIEDVNNTLAKYSDQYYTVEQICEKFNMDRDKAYGMLRYSDVRKVHEGRFALFLKEDIIRMIHERQYK